MTYLFEDKANGCMNRVFKNTIETNICAGFHAEKIVECLDSNDTPPQLVIEVNENNIINDVIALAGGLKDNAYTDNINLSKKVSDELVVYVFTKEEYKKNSSSNNTHTNTSSTSSSKESYQIDESTKNNISIITSSNSDEAPSQDTTSKLININTASAQELTSLPGIGETKANNIVSYRTENGYFKTIEDLKNVSGIGDATFEQLKDYITV